MDYPQAVLESQSLRNQHVHLFGKDAESIAPLFFRGIHGNIGVLDQRFSVTAVCGINMLMPTLQVTLRERP